VYALAKAVALRGVSEQAVYRLARQNGAPARIDLKTLQALCDVFDVGIDELLTREPLPKSKPKR
jgi:DNA-binding Xre family transcriptional regulator